MLTPVYTQNGGKAYGMAYIDVWRSKQVTTIHKTIRENRTQVPPVGVPFVSSLKNTKKNV